MTPEMRTRPTDPFSLSVFRILAIGAAICIATVHFTQPFLQVLATAFQLTKSEVSWVPTMTLLGYAFGIFFLIPLGDIISVRKLILIKLTILSLALLAGAAAPNFGFLLAMNFLTGFCASSVQDFVPIAAHLAPESRRGQVVGYVLTGMLLGSLLSRTAAGLITEFSNWRITFAVYGLSVAALVVVGLRLIPRLTPTSSASPIEIYKAMFQWCLKKPRILWLAFRHGLMGFCYSSFWVSLAFIMSAPPFNLTTAAVGYLAVPAVLGAFLGSWFGKKADQQGPRSNTLISASLVCVMSLAMYFFRTSVIEVIIYGVVVVLAYQISLVTSQFEILGIDAKARSQLNAILLTIQLLFFSVGSFLSVRVFNGAGGDGVALLCLGASLLSLIMAFLTGPINRGAPEVKTSNG